jgi:type IV pilus assembly protein PilC
VPSYRYLAVTTAGERIRSELKADSQEAAIRDVQELGHTLLSMAVIDPNSSAASNGDDFAARAERLWRSFRERVPLNEVAFTTRQLATMFTAGMTLERAVESLAENATHPRLKKALKAIRVDLQKGKNLSEALAAHPGAFNRLFVALVRAGEAGGTLGVTLERLADYLERSEDTRRKVVSAMYYPMFVMLILAVSVAVLVLKIAPMFDRVYRSFNAKLPAPTRALMDFSQFLINHALPGTVVLIILVVSGTAFALTPRGERLLHAAALKMPVLGSLLLFSLLATFARTFGLLLNSSVPVLDALQLTEKVVGHVLIREGIEQVRNAVKDGGNLHAALRKATVFPSMLVQLVATGEETGEIEKLLFKAAEYYEKQVEAMVSRLTSLIEPMLIVLMAVVVGTLVIIIYLPIFYLGMAMKRGLN